MKIFFIKTCLPLEIVLLKCKMMRNNSFNKKKTKYKNKRKNAITAKL